MNAELLDVAAPAKLNLFLHVTGRRADGYHELETVFCLLDWCDSLDFVRTTDKQLVRAPGSGAFVAPEEDLVLRAARALQTASGTNFGARIAYRKRIPTGAGLGGGSSDAASTLVALNRLWQTGFGRRELQDLALGLGADVPVFVFGQNAFARGVGELLQPLELAPKYYLLVQPVLQISTAGVFGDPDLTRNTKSVKITDFTAMQAGGADSHGGFGQNDLQAVVLMRNPQLASVLDGAQASGFELRMTGSGSCFFAAFGSFAQAKMQEARFISKIRSQPDGVACTTRVCRGLARHPLFDWLQD